MVGRHELADISVNEYQRRRAVRSSPTPPVPVPVEKSSAVEKASTILCSGWHEDQGGPQKKRGVHPTLAAIVVSKTWPFRESAKASMELASNVTVMIEIAQGFAEDLYQEGDLYAGRDKKIQLPRMKRPACVGESGAAMCRAIKAEAEAESVAPLGTLSTHSSDDDDRDIDDFRVNEPTVLPLGLVSHSLEEQLC